jgi:cysteine sulfinate desulfinase/cysteine desulfurase-like protein
VSAIVHESVLAAARAAQDHFGFEVAPVPVGANGIVEPDGVAALLDDRVLLVSIMTVTRDWHNSARA